MKHKPSRTAGLKDGLLQRVRSLTAQLRDTAERLHKEAEETRRLTEIARQEADRGRETSRRARQEALFAEPANWQLDYRRSGNGGNGGKR
jgi:RNA polymerase-binding transcription factor DksA